MAKTFPGVPESITREMYLSLVRATGLDMNDIMELRFTTTGIHAVVVERADNGLARIDENGGEVVTSTVFIPVEDGK